jgi:hypothetical protein
MTDDPTKKRGRPPKSSDDLVLTPGGPRPRSRVAKVEPGQHGTVEGGRVKIVETKTGQIIADLGAVGKSQPGKSRRGRAMKKAERPKPAK